MQNEPLLGIIGCYIKIRECRFKHAKLSPHDVEQSILISSKKECKNMKQFQDISINIAHLCKQLCICVVSKLGLLAFMAASNVHTFKESLISP